MDDKIYVFGLEAPRAEDFLWSPEKQFEQITQHFSGMASTSELVVKAMSRHTERIAQTHSDRTAHSLERLTATAQHMSNRHGSGALADDWQAYCQDAGRRAVLTLDTLRERGDIFLEHEAAGCPPVLMYDYEVVADGADLPEPCNYMLLRIVPPEGCEVLDWKRPYIIIDPRAGHGAGIGGFKTDSQVGVALRDGHPVYFVAFRRAPEPGQTLATVTRAEAEFVRVVMRRHPDGAKPVVVGNCQGGWATLLLAASNPDITGPICLNGAPVAPWSGAVGQDPMRYNGGVLGGTWQPMFWSDLGHGVFDGAHLVLNFEMLNPGRTWFRKYYDLFQDPDGGRARFLEFEKWWGGFFLLNEAEIRWIVEQLFVGNRLVKNDARLEPGKTVDIKSIRAPVIVFASHGDNITPPQQALNWIADSYADASEIRIRGQRIVYLVHDQIGHLGIFVSSKIARKEHTEVTSTLKTIEALPPGLYEMKIDEFEGPVHDRTFTVSFYERKLDDILALDDGREEEVAFASVARASEIQAQAYELCARPFVQAASSKGMAIAGRMLHPLRLQRALVSSHNPALRAMYGVAERMSGGEPATDNPFGELERLQADLIEQSLDFVRDLRNALYELSFLSLWGTPWARWFGRTHQPCRTLLSDVELRTLPEVQAALRHISEGGFPAAVIRMLVLLAESRGSVRRDRLERSARVLTQDEPFRSMPSDQRNQIIHEQTLIAQFSGDRALVTLPDLLPSAAERDLAARAVRYIPGAIEEMAPHTLEALQRFHRILGLPPVTEDVSEDPLADPDIVAGIIGSSPSDGNSRTKLSI